MAKATQAEIASERKRLEKEVDNRSWALDLIDSDGDKIERITFKPKALQSRKGELELLNEIRDFVEMLTEGEVEDALEDKFGDDLYNEEA